MRRVQIVAHKFAPCAKFGAPLPSLTHACQDVYFSRWLDAGGDALTVDLDFRKTAAWQRWHARGGLYVIRNRVTGEYYWGSAKRLDRRQMVHWANLRGRRHANPRLQSSWSKYGEQAFAFEIAAVIDPGERNSGVLFFEQRALRLVVGRPDCYNAARDAVAPMAGRKQSPETIAKRRAYRPSPEMRALMAERMRGRKMSPEAVEKSAAKRRGRPISPEHREKLLGHTVTQVTRKKIAAKNRGRVPTAEEREKMRAAQLARYTDPAQRTKLSVQRRGRRVTDAARARMSAAQRGRSVSPEHRAKLSAALKGRPLSAETRAKMSAARMGMKRSPEAIARTAAAKRGSKHTPDSRAKMAAAAKRRTERARRGRSGEADDGQTPCP